MGAFIAGLLLFFGVHSLAIAAPTLRARLIQRTGVKRWRAVYSVVSLGGFILLCYGFGAARATAPSLYLPPQWLRHTALLLMLPVFPLAFAAYLPGRIKSAVKHPMLAAIKCWALAHLLANGSAADVLLFGSFLAWAVADRISLKRRPAITVLQSAPPRRGNDFAAVAAGLGVYALMLFWLHLRLFGVSPLGTAG